jgi:hypothetical protein
VRDPSDYGGSVPISVVTAGEVMRAWADDLEALRPFCGIEPDTYGRVDHAWAVALAQFISACAKYADAVEAMKETP